MGIIEKSLLIAHTYSCNMASIDILGYVAGILVVISLLPQVIKSWKTKSTRDISLWRYLIYVTGLILWVTYAVII
jgi:MtN3 and saliva related transmembrane protein